MSGRADTDGLGSSAGGALLLACIFHLGRLWWRTGPGVLKMDGSLAEAEGFS